MSGQLFGFFSNLIYLICSVQSLPIFWADDEIKISPNISKVAQELATVLFTFKVRYFQIAKKSPNILAIFVTKIESKKYQNLPIPF